MAKDGAKPIMVYPDADTRKLIEEEAARKGWRLGPTVLRIVEKFFKRREQRDKKT